MLSVIVAPALAEKRVALVIGNGAYRDAPALPNPHNDAEDVASSLKRSGFDTVVGVDLDKAGMEQATIDFSRAARTSDIAIFYYSGHAMQYAGVNYLVPVDAKLIDEADVRRMTRVDEIVADLQQAKSLRILVLDSCRDNPLAEQLKRSMGATRAASIQRGVARIDSPEGMIIAYATQAGRIANDGAGRNSPYTAAFLKHIEEPEEIGTIFRRISNDVYATTKGEQLPELSLSFVGEVYLRGKLDIVVQPGITNSDPCAAAGDHWKSAEAIGTISAFEDHLIRFPNCAFANLAKTRIESMKNEMVMVSPVQPSTPPIAVQPPIPAAPSSTLDVRRFDGLWTLTLVCPRSNVPGWAFRLVGKVSNGAFRGLRGEEGKPGGQVFEGTIEPDGAMIIFVKGWSGDTGSDPFHRPKGTEFHYGIQGRLEGSHGTATRVDRDCSVKLAKQ